MELNEKLQALRAVALAYVEREKKIQYDQRCMDRALFLTPRRIKLIAPEAATNQKTVYLDCSSYVGAIYYETFGVELPADLTWHMVDYVKPCVYYHEYGERTPEELAKIEKDMRECLLMGDVITYDKGVGSGHTMIYLGDNKFAHCTPDGRPDSYDYVNCRSREYPDGGLFVCDLEWLFCEKRVFSPKIRRISIARPVLEMGELTKRTLLRMGEYAGLCMSVETSHPGTINADYGEEIEYRLIVSETKGEKRKFTAKIELPSYAQIVGDSEKVIEILPNEENVFVFKVRVDDEKAFLLENVKIFVGEFDVFTPDVLLGHKLRLDALDKVVASVDGNQTALAAAAQEYEKLGMKMERDEQKTIQNLFYLHDSLSGDVLTRKEQIPYLDGAVYSLFGGKGVTTPEMIRQPFIRVNQIRPSHLLPGDIIVVSDDAYGNATYSALRTETGLKGRFGADMPFEILENEKADQFIDSLFGKFCFAVLRPSFTTLAK